MRTNNGNCLNTNSSADILPIWFWLECVLILSLVLQFTSRSHSLISSLLWGVPLINWRHTHLANRSLTQNNLSQGYTKNCIRHATETLDSINLTHGGNNSNTNLSTVILSIWFWLEWALIFNLDLQFIIRSNALIARQSGGVVLISGRHTSLENKGLT